MKPPTALLIKNKPFYYPEFTNDLHYEAEIVLKICKNGKHLQPEFASGYYNEIGFGIDFTARDVQKRCKEKGHPWEIAKGFDNSAPISQFIPFTEEHQKGIKFQLKKNGELVQSGDTNDLIFSFDQLICHISKYFKLNLGDLLFTGTPAGVGPVQIGDVLTGYLETERMLTCRIK